jgi:mevalonate kinase
VLEEGGLGLAMAVERRVRIDILPAEELSIEGVWPGGALSWTSRQPSASPLIAAVVGEVENWLRENGGGKAVRGACIRVDSSALFSPDGRKSGLGSSAAVTAGLVCALLDAAGCRPGPADPAVLALAIKAHRRAQGGAGSGYDVSCSFHGGLGVFHGGSLPGWEKCRLWDDPVVRLFPGPSPVSTSEAIRRYAIWKESNPDDARMFLGESNRSVRQFVHARTAEEAERHLRACRELGVSLGRAIGISAEIEAPAGLRAAWCKALGAGNELGACLLPAGSAALPEGREMQPVHGAQEGILWEE